MIAHNVTRPKRLKLLPPFYGAVFLLLAFAGLFIGVFRSQDWLVALVLGMTMVFAFGVGTSFVKSRRQLAVFALGMLLASIFGVIAEMWGTANGYWIYHDLPNGRHLPLWLPFAWAFAFALIYVVERFTLGVLGAKGVRTKLLLAVALAAVLPAWGEMVAINAGVWTYTWPYQIAGVPLLAIVLLVMFHLGLTLLLAMICRRWSVYDPVLNGGPTDAASA